MKPNRALIYGPACAAAVVAGVLGVMSLPENTVWADDDSPATLTLTGVVRDFIEKTKTNGHPDFENQPSAGFSIYQNNVATALGADNKPVFVGGGKKTITQWKMANGKPIAKALYNPSLGDVAGTEGAVNTGGITSANSFNQWFNDVPGKNMSMPLSITFVKDSNGHYVFDDKLDPIYDAMGGFFPIDNQLFGNSGGTPNHNFHFTFELHCQFVYYANTGQMFKFIGDDDVFVFINGQKVIDLGGVHSAKEQFVDLDRLGLTDGQMYPLDFFFAERHRTQSNCRISTNLHLNAGHMPSVTSAFD
jgi:fibro-slime domain-containing protein